MQLGGPPPPACLLSFILTRQTDGIGWFLPTRAGRGQWACGIEFGFGEIVYPPGETRGAHICASIYGLFGGHEKRSSLSASPPAGPLPIAPAPRLPSALVPSLGSKGASQRHASLTGLGRGTYAGLPDRLATLLAPCPLVCDGGTSVPEGTPPLLLPFPVQNVGFQKKNDHTA